MYKIRVQTVIILFILSIPPIFAQQIEYVSSTSWNGINDIDVVDNLAYCAYNNGLAIFDYSDPQQPEEISRLYLEGETQTVLIDGILALMGSGTVGVQIVDISEPESPRLLSTFTTSGDKIDVAIFHNYVLVGDSDNGLFILDISDLQEPTEVYYNDIRNINNITVYNQNLFVSSSSSGVLIYDISDPEQPELISTIESESSINKTVVNSNILCTSAIFEGYISIYDISDIEHPVFASQIDECLWNIFIYDDYIYHTNYCGILIVTDISDPSDPGEVSRITVPGYANALEISNQFIYLGINYTGLYTYDISNPESPELSYCYETPSRIFTAKMHNGLVYAGGFNIIDYSDLYNPQLLSEMSFPEWVQDIHITDNYAYLVDGDNILNLIDIANPFLIDIVSTYSDSNYISGMAVSGDLVYLTVNGIGLQVLDYSNPESPELITEYSTIDDQFSEIQLSEDYAYIGCSDSGMVILDISDPTEPSYVSNFPLPRSCKSIQILDDMAYLVTNLSYHFVDISDPYNPVLISAQGSKNTAHDMWTDGHYAYFAETNLCRICDISDLPNIYSVAEYPTSGWADDIFVDGEYIYIADRYSITVCKFTTTGVDDDPSTVPSELKLACNYPNPFNASTTISYDIPSPGEVQIDIYDILGRKIETLVNGYHQAGSYSIIWNAGDLSSGMYLYKIQTGEFNQAQKCLLVK